MSNKGVFYLGDYKELFLKSQTGIVGYVEPDYYVVDNEEPYYKPNITAHIDDHKVYIANHDQESTSVYYDLALDREIDISDVAKLAHDSIIWLLFGKENMKSLQSEYFWINEAPGKSTPDYYCYHNDILITVEVKTNRVLDNSSFSEALEQYSSVLKSSQLNTLNLAICLAPNKMLISDCLYLNKGLARRCFKALIYIHHLQDILAKNYPYINFDRGKRSINIPFGLVSDSEDDKLLITKEMYSCWDKTHPDLHLPREYKIMISRQQPVIDQRIKDEEAFNGLYKRCNTLPNDKLLLKLGFAIPSIDSKSQSLVFPDSKRITNTIFSELFLSFLKSVTDDQPVLKCSKKHLYLRSTMEEYLAVETHDHCRGLWSTYTIEDECSYFRYVENDKVNTKVKEGRSMQNVGFKTFITPSLKERLSNQQASYRFRKHSLNYFPQDIDLTMYKKYLLESKEIVFPECANSYIDNNEVCSLPYQDESWFQHIKFWQRLVEEINIGRYSSKGNWNRFHVQRIYPYNAWLFTHGTGQDNHQFWYLIFHTEWPVLDTDDFDFLGSGWYCTKHINSLKEDKISQYLNILERLVSIRKFWDSVFYKEEDRSHDHFVASYLISMDAKQSTIDTLSLFRYVYMELCKEQEHRNVYKIWTKMPNLIRTPTLSWIVFRMSLLLKTNPSQPLIEENDSLSSQMDFRSLVSWVDGLPIPSFSIILSLSYMHYAIPHPTSIGLHGKVSIMRKLIQEELKLPQDKSKIGWSSPNIAELGDHEFSVSFMKALGEYASKFLMIRYPNWPSFWEEFSSQLSLWKLSDFATFKKSTRVDDIDPGKRAYCFEEVTKLCQRLNLNKSDEPQYSPYYDLNKLVNEQMYNENNRNVSIFVKDQQTGVREIFVLTINLRILIKLMEIFSRIINKCLPNETLSVPRRKHDLVINHSHSAMTEKINLIKKLQPQAYKILLLRYSSSSDAKAWCQQFCMPAFGCFIRSMLLKSYGEEASHLIDLIMFILNQITLKHIHIDDRVKRWMRDHQDVLSQDETFMYIMNMYKGRIEGLYEDGGIRNKSNMMQGIPHETSSTIHASYLLLASDVLSVIVNEFSKRDLEMIRFGKCVITNMVSSDDSGILFSIPVALKLDKNGNVMEDSLKLLSAFKEVMSRYGLIIENCKKLFSARVSFEKSTIFAETPVFEFNSKFYLGISTNTAEIKFVCSQFTIGYHANLQDRISEAMNSLSTCLAEGLRQDLINIIQLCLRRMHHRFLYYNWWDNTAMLELDRLSCPYLGTLPIVQPGFIGFFNLSNIIDYAYVKRSPFLKYLLMNRSFEQYDNLEYYSLYLKLGRKHQRLREKYGLNKEDFLSQLSLIENGDYDFLRRRLPESLMIKLKLLSPGLNTSMSFVNIAKIHMSSCYAANTACIKIKGQQEKITLWDAVKRVQSMVKDDFKSLLPNHTIVRLVELFDNSVEGRSVREQSRHPLTLTLLPHNTSGVLSVRERFLNAWVNGFDDITYAMLKQSQDLYPEISTSFKETLINCENDPFKLDSILFKLDKHYSNIRFIGHKPANKDLKEVYSSFLASNWKRWNSRFINYEVFSKLDYSYPLAELTQGKLKKIKDLVGYYMYGWKVNIIKQHFRKLILYEINDWTDIIPKEAILSEEEVFLLMSNNSTYKWLDLKKVDFIGNKIFPYSPDRIYVRNRGYWYLITHDDDGWKVFRDQFTPITILHSWKHVVKPDLKFYLSLLNCRIILDVDHGLSIRSNKWNSDSFKAIPSELKIKKESVNLFCLKGKEFVLQDYIVKLPSDYQTDFIKHLTKVCLGFTSEIRDFHFWESLSEELADADDDEGLNDCEKGLIRSLLFHVQQPVVSSEVTVPNLSASESIGEEFLGNIMELLMKVHDEEEEELCKMGYTDEEKEKIRLEKYKISYIDPLIDDDILKVQDLLLDDIQDTYKRVQKTHVSSNRIWNKLRANYYTCISRMEERYKSFPKRFKQIQKIQNKSGVYIHKSLTGESFYIGDLGDENANASEEDVLMIYDPGGF
ncbi:RNA-dependent RNA polymerase [Leishmania martiniquensis leishbunyavirus 1]|uniref:RNA-directed RNA polymerase L n=1 Tax=Leishmania martiniquensis leishbunyavirus 1 TaxID=2696682 RepID=A0A7U3RCZ9_9VIRU|nr:RNA-dependent RNA polymerase [Leishmania martiniquensis leishbunyavirus 1]